MIHTVNSRLGVTVHGKTATTSVRFNTRSVPRSRIRLFCMASTDSVPKVALITTLGCPYCAQAKATLAQANIPTQIVDLTDQPSVLTSIKQQTGQVTVPQIFVGGKLLGGASELKTSIETGQFTKLLDEAKSTPPLPDSVAAALATALSQQTSTATTNDSTTAAASNASSDLESLLTDIRTNFSTTTNNNNGGFQLNAVVDYIQKTNKSKTQDEAVATLSKLQSTNLITLPSNPTTPITKTLLARAPTTIVQCIADIPLPNQLKKPLNSHFVWYSPARPANEVAADLRRLMLTLFSNHLTTDGRKVDYQAMTQDSMFRKYVDTTAELQKVVVEGLERDEALCFWINIYNALILHATAAIGPATSTLSRLQWFDNISYEIASTRFTSNDIEHGVLRSNSPSPAHPFSLIGKPQWAGSTFNSTDPRRKISISPLDPRIHFALNCGANSCPPIKVYTPDRLETGLEAAAQAFCSSEVEVEESKMTLTMSMIFKWYGKDFGKKEDLVRYIAEHMTNQESKDALNRMLSKAGPGADGITLEYKPYDWGTNSK